MMRGDDERRGERRGEERYAKLLTRKKNLKFDSSLISLLVSP